MGALRHRKPFTEAVLGRCLSCLRIQHCSINIVPCDKAADFANRVRLNLGGQGAAPRTVWSPHYLDPRGFTARCRPQRVCCVVAFACKKEKRKPRGQTTCCISSSSCGEEVTTLPLSTVSTARADGRKGRTFGRVCCMEVQQTAWYPGAGR